LGLLSPPIPSFSGISKVKTFQYHSAFNAQGSRLIIIVVQLGAVKTSVAAVEAEKRKTGWNSVYHQNWWFSEFHPPLNANVLFYRCFLNLNLTLCMTKLRVLVLCFFYFTDRSTIWSFYHVFFNV
jgi:hypothetical protein